jgi:hypothetical protein
MVGGVSLYESDPVWLPAVLVGAVMAVGGAVGLLFGGSRSERASASELTGVVAVPSDVQMLSDTPTEDDEFGRSRYAETLANVALSAATPLVVALYGSWGSGKTSLMYQIRRRLESNHDPKSAGVPGRRVRTVWFDPWMHQFDQTPAVGLLHAITDQLNLTAITEAQETLKKIALALAEDVQIPYLGLHVGRLAKVRSDVADEEFRRRELQARLREYFERILHLAGTPGTRLVVFIDDLDRCQPRRTVDVLEALKLYLDFPACVYILGVDRESVEAAIKGEYTDLGITESSYLDKIVQLPVTLPAIGEQVMRNFINKRMPEELKDCTEILVAAGADDPRQVKRILNALMLSHKLLSSVVPEYQAQILAALILIQNFSPDLYRELRLNPSAIHELFRGAVTEGTAAESANGPEADAADENAQAESRPVDPLATDANLWAQYVEVRPRLAAALRTIYIPPSLDLRPYLTFTAVVAAPAEAEPDKAQAGPGRTAEGHAIRFTGEAIFADALAIDAAQLGSLASTARAALRDSGREAGRGHFTTSKEAEPVLLSELTRLAVVGYRIFTALFASRQDRSSIAMGARQPGVVPITLGSLTAPTPPVAVLYDRPIDTGLPVEDYILCRDFSAALETGSNLTDTACWHGDCPGCDDARIICPSGFWGFRHALGLSLPIHNDMRQPILIQYTDAPVVLLAIATNIDGSQEHSRRIADLAPTLYMVNNRRDLRDAMTRSNPNLIYFFGPGGEEDGIPWLSIGGHPGEERIDPMFLHATNMPSDSKPIVVINSGMGGAEFADFARAFIADGSAAGVIGAEAPPTVRDATYFGEALIRRLLAGQEAGWAVRDARLDLLMRGSPLGLAYTPFIAPEVHLVRTDRQ